MRLLIILLYNSGLYILLIDSIIDIIYFILLISRYKFFMIITVRVAETNISNRSIIIILTRFFPSYFLSFNSLGATFLFINHFFISHFLRRFVLYLDLWIKWLLIIIIYLVWDTHIKKYLAVLGLYLISILYQVFW